MKHKVSESQILDLQNNLWGTNIYKNGVLQVTVWDKVKVNSKKKADDLAVVLSAYQ